MADQGNDILVRQLGPDDRDAYFSLRLQGLKAHPEAFAMSYGEALQRGPSLHDATLQGTEAARRLYESFGFRTYGREIGAMCIDGVLHDADHMARHL